MPNILDYIKLLKHKVGIFKTNNYEVTETLRDSNTKINTLYKINARLRDEIYNLIEENKHLRLLIYSKKSLLNINDYEISADVPNDFTDESYHTITKITNKKKYSFKKSIYVRL